MTSQQISRKMSKLGQKGGRATAKRKGKRFFSLISKKRKHFRGGRKPSKRSKPVPLTIIDG